MHLKPPSCTIRLQPDKPALLPKAITQPSPGADSQLQLSTGKQAPNTLILEKASSNPVHSTTVQLSSLEASLVAWHEEKTEGLIPLVVSWLDVTHGCKNHSGWKRPLRSSNPPTSPPQHACCLWLDAEDIRALGGLEGGRAVGGSQQ